MPPRAKPNEEAKQIAALLPLYQQAKAAGVPLNQIENFVKAGLLLLPKQLEFVAKCRECDLEGGPTSVMFSGGRGSSKSHGGASQVFADDCQRFAGIKFLYLRKVGRANKEQIQDIRKSVLGLAANGQSKLPHEYLEQKGVIRFPNGSEVIIGNYKDERDLDKYLGIEYDGILIEEANQLSFSKQKNIFSCLRTSKVGWRPRAYLMTNPGGVGHYHNKKIYYEPWKEKRETDTRFVHSTVLDNPFVNKEYLSYLESLVGWQRQAWLYGSWEYMQGAYFSNFSPDTHTYPRPGVLLDMQKVARWFGGFDRGLQHATAFVLFAEDFQKRQYIVDCYSECEKVIEENAENIRALLHQYHLTPDSLDFIAAGRDCFSRNDEARTTAEAYEEHGMTLMPAEVDRLNGWSVMMSKFGNISQAIVPTLFVHVRCEKLIEQLQVAQHCEKRPGDIEKFNVNEEGEGGDDLLDATRFACATEKVGIIKFARPVSIQRLPFVGYGL